MLSVVVRIAGAYANLRSGHLVLNVHLMKLAPRNSSESPVFANQHLYLISTGLAFRRLAYLTQVLHPRGSLSHLRFRRLHGLHAISILSAHALSDLALKNVAMSSASAGQAEMGRPFRLVIGRKVPAVDFQNSNSSEVGGIISLRQWRFVPTIGTEMQIGRAHV